MQAMSIRTSPWPAGVPCWADLMVPDVQAAGAFYAAVLGWEVPAPDEEHGGYVVAHRGGHAVAGIGPDQPGARTAWTLYLATDDADATTATAEQYGATVLSAPDDVGPLGRMALLTDPAGTRFGLWQGGTFIGAQLVNEPGGLVWEDLRSSDPAAAQAFYRAVFGYELEPLEMAGPDYSTFRLPEETSPLGGMGDLMGSDSPHWLVYFGSADADAALAAVEAHGGTVTTPAFDSPFGRMGGAQDPWGAQFWLAQAPPGAPQPDRAG